MDEKLSFSAIMFPTMLQQVQHMVWEQGVVVYLKTIFQIAKMLSFLAKNVAPISCSRHGGAGDIHPLNHRQRGTNARAKRSDPFGSGNVLRKYVITGFLCPVTVKTTANRVIHYGMELFAVKPVHNPPPCFRGSL